ncbi:hypothetical protein [Yoonia sp. I 8.24]|uniref:hypothetical protein n=1 Tax=Yoonia sp. I 8.24 TaxID=1537229 RepID=UPI001EDFA46A|nr:hypothetical protein [Yoonia sp. I 8.24]MCG3266808.1 hypothetical protein [Yoonia sp. I 8.24]
MARFAIDLGEMPMSKEDQLQLQNELQSVALKHVARLGYDKPFAVKFPREWWGIILHPDLDRLGDIEAEIGKRLGAF